MKKYIITSVITSISLLLYITICFTSQSLIGDKSNTIIILLVKWLSFTIALIGINILVIGFIRKKALQGDGIGFALLGRILIIFIIVFADCVIIDHYFSNLNPDYHAKNYAESIDYIYDIKQITHDLSSDNIKSEYYGKVTLSKREKTSGAPFGTSFHYPIVYYICSEDNRILGVLSEQDLKKYPSLKSTEDFHIVYYQELKLIDFIEAVDLKAQE